MKGIALLWIVITTTMLSSCSTGKGVDREPLLVQEGQLQGLATETFRVDQADARWIVIELQQTGLDLQIEVLNQVGEVLGRFDSGTGRYGDDIAIVAADPLPITIKVGSPRLPKVSGIYRLTIRADDQVDDATRLVSEASRLDVALSRSERLKRFEKAAIQYRNSGRIYEAGLAGFAALRQINDVFSDAKRAITVGAAAVSALGESDRPLLLASALASLAFAYAEAGDEQRMSASFDEAAQLFETHGSVIGAAEVKLFRAAARYPSSAADIRAAFLEASRTCESIGESMCHAIALTDLGIFDRDQGHYDAAFQSLYRAVSLVSPNADPAVYAAFQDNLAGSLRMLGDFDAAIAHYRLALQAYKDHGECSGVARSLYGLGYSLFGVGATQDALRFYKLALDRSCAPDVILSTVASVDPTANELCQMAADLEDSDLEVRSTAAFIAWDLGNLARAEPNGATAMLCHAIAARLATTENRRLGARLEGVLDLLTLGRVNDAATNFERLRENIDRSDSAWYRAQAFEVESRILAAQGRDEAFERFDQAAQAYQRLRNKEGAFLARSAQASFAFGASHPQAQTAFVEADAALEDVRLMSLDPAFSAGLFAAGRAIYEDWVEHEIKSVPAPESVFGSLLVSERSRARLLAQLIRASNVDVEARVRQMKYASTELATLLDNVELGQFDAAVDSVRIETPVASKIVLAAPVSRLPRFDEQSQFQLKSEIREFQQSLNDSDVVVEYLLGERRGHVWIVRKTEISRVELPAAALIRNAVSDVARSMEGADTHRLDQALEELHELIVRPLGELPPSGHLIVVPDDALFGIPFAALKDRRTRKYLIEALTVSLLPSIQIAMSAPDADLPNDAVSSALLIGDPVYEQEDAIRRCGLNVGSGSGARGMGLRRISASKREVEGIRSLLEASELPAKTLFGCDATHQDVIEAASQPRRYLHFATHATADADVPHRSAIYLSAFGRAGQKANATLTAGELLRHHVRADLVVLSGCATAGGRHFPGEATMGLSFSFIANGSNAVLSTLWPVADTASAEAMRGFYEGLLRGHLSNADALRKTQLTMLKSKRWNHPRHWAPYVLMEKVPEGIR